MAETMPFRRYILLVACLLFLTSANTQTPSAATLSLLPEGDSLFRLDFSHPSAPELHPDTLGFSVISWPGLHFGTGRAGLPDLPVATALLRLPKGSTLAVDDIRGKPVVWPHAVPPSSPLRPMPRPWPKDSPFPGYDPDKAAYSTDTLFRGGSTVGLENLGVMGDCQLFRITLRPLAYNPASGDLLYHPSITALLRRSGPKTYAPNPPPPERFLIVSRPHYRETLQPFVQWKRREGYEVIEIYATTHRRDSVKNLMRPLFDGATPLAPAPRYILLVGDVADLQSFIGTSHPSEMDDHLTDLPYSDFTGDNLPDAVLGRWPVNDTGELNVVLRKTLHYEQGLSLDTAALNRVLLVAGHEQTSPAPTTTNGQVNYLKREIKLNHPSIDTICHYNPASADHAADIASTIGQGISLLNYSAHCTVGGWTSPSLSLGSIDTLQPHMPLLYVNNCCKSNDFGGTGFGEQLLRLDDGGAIGVIGATNNTLWNEDYYWAVGPKYPVSLTPDYQDGLDGAFDRWIGRSPTVQTQGELLQAGNLSVTAFGSPYSSFYWQTYCLLGDPTLKPYMDIPQPASATLATSPRNGQTEMSVIGTPGARVSAVQGETLLGVADLDSVGQATLSLIQPLDTGFLFLTATGQNLLPYLDTLVVNAVIDRGVALRNVQVSDSVLIFSIENIGHQRLDGVEVSLAQYSTDTLVGALIVEQDTVVHALLPGATQSLVFPVALAAIGPAPFWQAHLLVQSDTLLCSLTLRHSLREDNPSLTLRLFNPDGTETRRLLPSRTYTLFAEVDGPYDSLRLHVEDISTDSTQLTFSTPGHLCNLRIAATIYRDRWHHSEQLWLVPGERMESFEEGFASYPWNTHARVPWVIDSSVSHSGRYCLRSGAIGHDQTSDLSIDVFLPHDDTVSFWAKLSTEVQRDIMIFFVDGQRCQPVLWGELDWRRYRHPLSAGHHTLLWRYQKDNSVNHGSDCVWLDDISMPMVYWDVPAGWQCIDTTVGINDVHVPESTWEIYPNPASGKVNIRVSETMEVYVTDALGRRVASLSVPSGETCHWDASRMPAGVYFVSGQGFKGTICTKIIILKD